MRNWNVNADGWFILAAAGLLCVSLVGCSGNDGGNDTSGDPDVSTDTEMPDSGPEDTFSGECRTASDCEPPSDGSNKQAACTASNTCTYLCAEGYQDQNGDDTCQPTCETSDITCETGECIIRDGSPACTCPDGLAFDDESGECQLSGILEDNSFEEADGWQVSGDASINASDGDLVFEPGTHTDNASASQTYERASFDEIGQLKLSITYSLPTECQSGCRTPDVVARANFNGVPQGLGRFPNPDVMNETASTCVGTAAYDGAIDFRLTPGTPPEAIISPDKYPTIKIHDVTLTRASDGECPPQGTVENGDFESSLDGNWSIRPDNSSTTNQVVDRNGDRAMELGGTECTGAYARQKLSIPRSDQTALTFSADVTGSTALLTQADRLSGTLQSEISQTDGAETQHVCVPSDDLGAVRRISFEPAVFAGTCDRSISSSFIDDVRFTQRSECQ